MLSFLYQLFLFHLEVCLDCKSSKIGLRVPEFALTLPISLLIMRQRSTLLLTHENLVD